MKNHRIPAEDRPSGRSVGEDRNRVRGFPMALWWLSLALLAAGTCAIPLAGFAQNPVNRTTTDRNGQVNEIESITAVSATRYGAGGLHRFLFGDDYRDLWRTPISVRVLSLEEYEGGLTVLRRGGGRQTKSLHFTGADGRRFVFRSLDKNPGLQLDEELRGTVVEYVLQDQISALHPAAALVVAPLLKAVGVLHATPELVVLPDSPLLGEHRAEFAGTLGLLAERPDEGPDETSGFAGSRKITGSEGAFEAIGASPRDRFDAEDFLRARLVDLLVGDRDRHKGQWRWARYDGETGYVWRPIPEDRDQAFIRADGLALGVGRLMVREWATFSDTYPSVERLTFKGWDLDRYILPQLSPDAWARVVEEVQTAITDGVILEAVHHLPIEFVAMRGGQLVEALKRRRTYLPVLARDYYRMISAEAELHGTMADEYVEVHSRAGAVTVRMFERDARGNPTGQPFFQRRFDASETRELRIYLSGGRDRAVVAGTDGSIVIRVIGGTGPDQLVDSSSAEVHLYDADAADFVRSRNTKVNTTPFTPPPSSDPAHATPPDWGTWRRPAIGFSASRDRGVFLGGGAVWYRYGFRKYPYASRTSVRVGFLTGAMKPKVRVEQEWRHVADNLHVRVDAMASGIERLRFHGVGNESVLRGPREYHRINQTVLVLAPRVTFEPKDDVRFWTGPIAKRTSTVNDPQTYLAELDGLYGVGSIGQVGVQGGFELDARDHPVVTRKGVYLTLAGSLYPRLIDLRQPFGEVHGEIGMHYTLGPTFAFRAGGKRLWGAYPFYEAAFLGGSETIRGFREERFAGDASAYGNGEVRLKLGTVSDFLPTDVGVFALGDVGRVFSAGETSNTWHTSYGGGVWFSVLKYANTISVAMARSVEGTELHVRGGFLF